MDNFTRQLFLVVFLFVIGFAKGLINAYTRKSPLSKKGEMINYHKYLAKPVMWSFIIGFILFLLLGFTVNKDYVEVAKKSLLAGLYASAGIYVFMIWGANLIRNT